MITFGEYVKQKRLEKEITLRAFCKKTGFDPSNWSKVERGYALPTAAQVDPVAEALGVYDREEYFYLTDLCHITRHEIPTYVMTNEKLAEMLPVFFCAAHGKRPTEEQLNNFIELLKKDYGVSE